MDERRLLMALPPVWRMIVIDLILVGSWAACVAICCPLIQLATDHPMVICIIASIAPGTLLFWGAIAAAQFWCAVAEQRVRKPDKSG